MTSGRGFNPVIRVLVVDDAILENTPLNLVILDVEIPGRDGLRLGFTRAPNESMTRIDIGWPLNNGGFAMTVGSEHQF